MKLNQILLFAGFTAFLSNVTTPSFFATKEERLTEEQADLDASKASAEASSKASFKKDQTLLNAKKKKQSVKHKARRKAEKVKEDAKNKRMKAQDRDDKYNY